MKVKSLMLPYGACTTYNIYFSTELDFRMSEALDILYNDDIDADEIFIEPPEPCVQTDEDSGDENNGEVDNLSAPQLRSKAEIKLANNKRYHGGIGDDNIYPEERLSSKSGTSSEQYQHVSAKRTDEWIKKIKTGLKSFTWIKGGDFEELQLKFPQPDFSKYKNLSIVDIFETFLNYDTINCLVDETIRYALFLNCLDPHIITHDEIRCFISILYLSGYNKLPSKKSFWDSMDDMNNKAVVMQCAVIDFCKYVALFIVHKFMLKIRLGKLDLL